MTCAADGSLMPRSGCCSNSDTGRPAAPGRALPMGVRRHVPVPAPGGTAVAGRCPSATPHVAGVIPGTWWLVGEHDDRHRRCASARPAWKASTFLGKRAVDPVHVELGESVNVVQASCPRLPTALPIEAKHDGDQVAAHGGPGSPHVAELTSACRDDSLCQRIPSHVRDECVSCETPYTCRRRRLRHIPLPRATAGACAWRG